jgi:tRNA A37 threonylcarbamoyladenosine dehydratase
MNRFHRTELMVGQEGMERLRDAYVTVAGLGGVGGAAVEALARSGIGHLRLIDSDIIGESNMNRQLLALESTIGKPKAELAAKRVHDINPACEVDIRQTYINDETTDTLLHPTPDVLIDAIDTLSPKVGLLQKAIELKIPYIISSMGAANKFDPTAVRIADLSKTRHCRLAKFIRKRLRRRGISNGITCVYSEEPPLRGTTPDDLPDFENPSKTCDGKDRAPLGSTPWLPPVFGFHAAAQAVQFLLQED